MSRLSLPRLADGKVPFPLAARWAGIDIPYDDAERGIKAYCPFGEVEHPDGGREPAMRVYPDHGWCFAESRHFTVTSLLAEVWQVSRDDAAAEALRRISYKPVSYAHLFEQAAKEQEPDRGALTAALVTWCESRCRECGQFWAEVRLHPAIARQLSRCLGLLPLVRTEEDCMTWLSAAKEAMRQVLS